MNVDRRTFLALLGAGGAAAALPPVFDATRAPAGGLPRPAPVANGATNRYLEGMYAPVTQEVTALDLPITGVLPPSSPGATCATGPTTRTHRALVRGRRHAARRPAARRAGRVVSQPWVRSRAVQRERAGAG
jgi:hypothetical protein